jgi:hypothetical protein
LDNRSGACGSDAALEPERRSLRRHLSLYPVASAPRHARRAASAARAIRPQTAFFELLWEPEIASDGKRRSYAFSASEQAMNSSSLLSELCKSDEWASRLSHRTGINREVPARGTCQQSCSGRNLGGFEDRRLTQHELLDAIRTAIPDARDGEDEGWAGSVFRSQGHLHCPHDPICLRVLQRQPPVDGSVGERDLRPAASCGAQAVEELALPECRRALRKVATPMAERRPGGALCCGGRMSEWVCAIVPVRQ